VPNTLRAQSFIEEDLPIISGNTLQARKQELVRNAIWDAATDLFAEKGYDETTVDDIALKAGISRRSFFRYFSSKSDLMGYGIVGYGAQLIEAIEACPRECSLSEVFRRTVLQVARQCAAHPRTRRIMGIAVKYPAAKEAHLSRTPELQERVEAAIARRYGTRSGGDLTPRIVTQMILAVLSLIFMQWFERGDEDISETAEQILGALELLVGGDRKTRKNRA
jgi:AcrR family transcriptional regulator